jgi:hypothetical protein
MTEVGKQILAGSVSCGIIVLVWTVYLLWYWRKNK